MAKLQLAHGAFALLVLLLLAGATYLAEHVVVNDARTAAAARAAERLQGTRLALEQRIARDVHTVHALATYLAVHPRLGTAALDGYVMRLLDPASSVRHLAIAPDLVVAYVHPLTGNEPALGLDYRAVPAQHPGVQRAIEAERVILSGPHPLVQGGGDALFARHAVFVTDPDGTRRLWGVVSAVIDPERVYAAVGLRDDAALEYALRGREEDGTTGATFFGNAAVFDDSPLLAEIGLPDGTWQIAARPRAGWHVSSPRLVDVIRLIALGLALIVLGFTWTRLRQEQALGRALAARACSEAALRQSRQDLVNSIESISEGYALWDRDDRLQLFNQRMIDITPDLAPLLRLGISFEELIERVHDRGLISDPASRADWIAKRIARHRDPGQPFELETTGGRIVRVAEHRTTDGNIVGIYTDITDIKRAQADIQKRAYYDLLTELPNRENFMTQLVATLRLTARDGTHAALLFVDLDRFKNINDTLGHAIGDRLLREAAQRLSESVRQTDTVARFGGDEFTVLLRDIGTATNAARVAEQIIERLAAPYEMDSHTFHCGASIGISLAPDDDCDAQRLLRNADMAMYQAKAQGRNTFRFYTAAMTARASAFVTMEKDLRLALAHGQFTIDYQPIVDLDNGRLAGAEALLRWTHPERGAVPPAEFVPIAEDTRLINPIGAWALANALDEARDWCTRRATALPYLAFNVSSRQLLGDFDPAFIHRLLVETGFPPAHLVFEITESVLLEDDPRVDSSLRAFRALGIGIVVDDFGTGYSALSYLRRMPVTALKIDGSFVRNIENDENDANLVESIVAMARALRIGSIAECVETQRQAHILRTLGCRHAQGYLYGRPVPAAQFAQRWLEGGEFAPAAG